MDHSELHPHTPGQLYFQMKLSYNGTGGNCSDIWVTYTLQIITFQEIIFHGLNIIGSNDITVEVVQKPSNDRSKFNRTFKTGFRGKEVQYKVGIIN